jgi:NADH:ubiquinone oxidoreductase subunit
MQNMVEKLLTFLKLRSGKCQYVGKDAYGNHYYEQIIKNSNPKRWVIYKGKAEASKVPPGWHGWLHHTSKAVPVNKLLYSWQKPHLPNLSGTPFSYKPTSSSFKRKDVGYEPWNPEGL